MYYQNMDDSNAAEMMAALAHKDRLRAFRLLMHHAPDGLSAGDIARALQIAPSSLTFHLGVLKRAGLVDSHRVRRSIFYKAALQQMHSILEFLINDCCEGHPEVCGFGEREKPSDAANR